MNLEATRSVRTSVFPWRALLLIGGVLLLMLAGTTLAVVPRGGWLVATVGALGVGGAMTLLGLALVFRQRHQSGRGLNPTTGLGTSTTLLLVGGLLLLAFLISLAPIPLPYIWLSQVLPWVCMAAAGGVARSLVRGGAPAELQIAQRAYTRGDLDTALAALRAAEQSRPAFYGIHQLYVLIHRRRKDYTAAHEAAQRLIAMRPDLYYGYAELGLTLLEEGHPSAAREPLRCATEVAPGLAEGHFNLGLACAEAEDQTGAVAALSQALRLGLRDDVTHVMARYFLYQALVALGRHIEARTELGRLRRRAGVVRRWREDLQASGVTTAEQRREQSLVSAIERLIMSWRSVK